MEKCYLMVKPEFANNREVVLDILSEIKSLGVNIEKCGYVQYSRKDAMNHYVEKKDKPFFDELVDYISSDFVFGIVAFGDNAIDLCREKTQYLREHIKNKYNLETSLTKNILHCTSKILKDGIRQDIDSKREIDIFLNRLNEFNNILKYND